MAGYYASQAYQIGREMGQKGEGRPNECPFVHSDHIHAWRQGWYAGNVARRDIDYLERIAPACDDPSLSPAEHSARALNRFAW